MNLYSADEDGTRRTVYVAAGADAAIVMGTQDLAAGPRAAFGQGEYEFEISIKSEAFSEPLVQLLAERYAGDREAVDHFREWLVAHKIQHSFWNRIGD